MCMLFGVHKRIRKTASIDITIRKGDKLQEPRNYPGCHIQLKMRKNILQQSFDTPTTDALLYCPVCSVNT